MKHLSPFQFRTTKIFLLTISILFFSYSYTEATIENFESEATGATTFSEGGVTFNTTGSLEVGFFTDGGSNGTGDDKFLEAVTGGSVGDIQMQTAGMAFQINNMDVWLSANSGNNSSSGVITLTGTLFGGGTVTDMITVNPANSVSWTAITIGGTNLDGAVLSSVAVSISSGLNYIAIDDFDFTALNPNDVNVSINDISLQEGDSGNTPFQFTVTRSNNNTTFSVTASTANGSASSSTDYMALGATTVNFTSGGSLTQTVSVNVNADFDPESDENFFVNLTNPTNGAIILDNQGEGNILDDDTICETFEDEAAAGLTSFAENGTSFSTTDELVTGFFAGGGGGSGSSDYYLESNINNFPHSASVGEIQITTANTVFEVLQMDLWLSTDGDPDTSQEGMVTFVGTIAAGGTAMATLMTSNLSTAWTPNRSFNGTPLDGLLLTSLEVILPSGGDYVAIDNFKFAAFETTSVLVSIDDVCQNEGNSGNSNFTFTISRSDNSTTFDVTVQSDAGTATPGTDYTSFGPVTLNFIAGGATSQTVNVSVSGDTESEPPETFFMNLSNITGGAVIASGQGQGIIKDDDTVCETFEDEGAADLTAFSEGGISFSTSGELVTDFFGTGGGGSGGSDYYLDSDILNFPHSGSVGTITVTTPGFGIELLRTDLWLSTDNDPNNAEISTINLIGSIVGGGTATVTLTSTGTGGNWSENLMFAGTAFDGIVLSAVEVVLTGQSNYVAFDNICFEPVGLTTCPTVGALSASETSVCPNQQFDLTATGLADMAMADNDETDFGIEFVAFPSLVVNPYGAGGTSLGTVPFGSLTGGNTVGSLVGASISPPLGTYHIFAILSPAPADANCRPSATTTIVVEDNDPPTITCPANISVNNDPGDCGALVNFPAPSASDNCSATVSCSPMSGTFFAVGTTSVICTATDPAGNTGNCSFTVTVIDTESPTINCPGNISADNDAGQCGAIVSFSPPTANDNCPGVTFSCSPMPGSFFPVGTTPVTCTATDASGNTTQCSFNVTVNDTEDPVISCGTIGPNLLANPGFEDGRIGVGAQGWTSFGNVFTENIDPFNGLQHLKMFGNFSGGFNVSGAFQTVAASPGETFTASAYMNSLSSDPMSGGNEALVKIAFLDAGATELAFSESAPLDASSPLDTWILYSTTSTAPPGTVDVQFSLLFLQPALDAGAAQFDDASITVVTSGDIVVDNDPGQCGAVVNFSPTTNDNCPGVTASCSPMSGSFFAVGTNSVTCTATDAAGNTSQCSFNITVNDAEPPTIPTCPPNTTVDACGPLDLPAGTIGLPFSSGLALINSTQFSAEGGSWDDNCTPQQMIQYQDVAGGSCPTTITRTFTVTDQGSNSVQCQQEITIQDQSPPEITCPADPPIIEWPAGFNLGQVGPNTPQDPSIDPFGVTTQSSITTLFDGGNGQSGNMFDVTNVSSNPVTITSFDLNLDNGTTSNIDVYHTTNPGSFLGNESNGVAGGSNANWTLLGQVAGLASNGEGVPTPLAVGGLTLLPGETYGIFIIVTNGTNINYTDGAMTFNDGVLEINAGHGNGAPPFSTTFFNPRSWNGTVYYNTASQGFGEATATDNCGNPSISYQDELDGPTQDCNALWTVTRTWTATDACGLTASCDQTFTFTDTTPPTIICPADPQPIEWPVGFNTNTVPANTPQDPSIDPGTFGDPVVDDNCAVASVDYQDAIFGPVPQDCPNLWTVQRTWTVTDVCGLTATCIQTFTFTDTTPPVITCPVTGQPQPPVPLDEIEPNDVPGDLGVQTLTGESILNGTADQIPLTDLWIIPDGTSGDITVQVSVPISPTTLVTINCHSDPQRLTTPITFSYLAIGPPLTVTLDGNLFYTITVFDFVPGLPYSILVTGPALQGYTGGPIEWPAGFNLDPVPQDTPQDAIIDPAITGFATGTDNCGAPIVSYQDILVGPDPGNCPILWVVERTWTVTDFCGLTSTCLETFEFQDTTPPDAICQSATVNLDATGNITLDPNEFDNGSSDNCAIASISVSPNMFDCTQTGVHTIVFTVTDACGLTATCETTVDIVNPAQMTLSAVVMDQTGPTFIDGSIDLTVAGGTPPLTYLWSNGSTDEDLSGLIGPIDYDVTVTDANGCFETATYFVDQGTIYPTRLCLKVFLQGSFNPSTTGPSDRLRTTLNNNGLLPDNHPYNVDPWNYMGTESFDLLNPIPTEMVDWVLVRVRDGSDPSIIVGEQACVLLSDGSIRTFNDFLPVFNLDYLLTHYIEILHRNHLPVVTPNPLQPDLPGGDVCHDYTTAMTQAFRQPLQNDDPMKQLNSLGGVFFAMHTGNVQSLDLLIDANDIQALFGEYNMSNQYQNSDTNMDTMTDANDINLLFGNYNNNAHTPY